MNKRGVVENVILMLVKMAIGVFLLLILIAGFFALGRALFGEKQTLVDKDRLLVRDKLPHLLPDRTEEARTSCVAGQCPGYTLKLLPSGNDEPQCGGVPCICSQEKDSQAWECDKLEGVETDCKKGVCVASVTTAEVEPYNPKEEEIGEPVFVCRKGNELRFGTC